MSLNISKQKIIPKSIKKLTSIENRVHAIEINWSDSFLQSIDLETLRKHCPCAYCLEQRGDSSHQKPLSPKKSSLLKVVEATKEESLELKEIWLVGNYAIGILWGDKHDSGIYSFDYLRTLNTVK